MRTRAATRPTSPRVRAALQAAQASAAEGRAARTAALAYNTNGQAAFKAGEYATAADFFSQALALHPDNPRYAYARANCYRNLGDNERCLADYSVAIQADPSVAHYHASRGTILRKLGRLDDALADLTQAVAMDPTNATHCFNRALVLSDMGEAARAVGDFTAAIEVGSDGQHAHQTSRAHFHRGVLLHQLGRYREAASDQRVVLRAERNNAPALNALGLALGALGEAAEAVSCFSQAIELDRRAPSYHANRAAAFRALARFPDALADLAAAIALSPADASLRAQLGETHADCGGLQQSAEAFAQAVALEPGSAQHTLSFGRALYLLGQLDGARAQIEAALAAEPTFGRAHYQLGLLSYAQGRLADALRAFDRAAFLDSATDGPHIAAAAVLLDTRQPAEALRRLDRALGILPGSVRARLLRARALLALSCRRRGRRDNAGVQAGAGQAEADEEEEDDEAGRQWGRVDVQGASEALSDVQRALGAETEQAAARQERDRRAEEAAALTRGRAPAASPPPRGPRTVQFGASPGAAGAAGDAEDEEVEGGAGGEAERSPLRAELLGQRALILLTLSQHAQAMADLSAALRHVPNDARWLGARALCHAAQANLKAAETDLNLAIAAATQAAAAAREVANGGGGGGGARALAGISPSIVAAIAADDALFLLAPATAFGDALVARLRHQRAAVLFRRGKYGASAAELRRLLPPPPSPFSGSAAAAEGGDAAAAGGGAGAECALEKARRPPAAFLLGLCHARQGEHLEAVRWLNEAVVARPRMPLYRHERAKALQLAHEHAAALHDFSAVLAAQPDNAAARFRRGFAHKALFNYEQAAADFEGAKLLQPRAPELVLSYAHIHAVDTIELCAPGDEPDTPPLIY